MTEIIKKLRKNEYLQTAIIVVAIVLVTLGLYWAETNGYVAVVPTGSMCIPKDGICVGWDDVFEHTIHVGDLLVIMPVNPVDLNAIYPDSDIIVYQNPRNPNPDLIVHRIVAETEINGTIAFYTKGDGNGWNKWPNPISPAEYDPWSPVPSDLIVGKVVMRIPWIGHFTLFVQSHFGNNDYLIPVVVVLILLLVIIEFIAPLFKHKKQLNGQTVGSEKPEPSPSNELPSA